MELNREQLKLEAFKQELVRLQDQNADYRVEITLLNGRVQELEARINELTPKDENGVLEPQEEPSDPTEV